MQQGHQQNPRYAGMTGPVLRLDSVY